MMTNAEMLLPYESSKVIPILFWANGFWTSSIGWSLSCLCTSQLWGPCAFPGCHLDGFASGPFFGMCTWTHTHQNPDTLVNAKIVGKWVSSLRKTGSPNGLTIDPSPIANLTRYWCPWQHISQAWLQLVLLAALQLPEQLPVAPKFAELPGHQSLSPGIVTTLSAHKLLQYQRGLGFSGLDPSDFMWLLPAGSSKHGNSQHAHCSRVSLALWLKLQSCHCPSPHLAQHGTVVSATSRFSQRCLQLISFRVATWLRAMCHGGESQPQMHLFSSDFQISTHVSSCLSFRQKDVKPNEKWKVQWEVKNVMNCHVTSPTLKVLALCCASTSTSQTQTTASKFHCFSPQT